MSPQTKGEAAELPEDIKGPAKPDAFTSLMAASTGQNRKRSPVAKRALPRYVGRDGLGAYLINSQTPLLLYQNDFAVVIRDLYPKATVHTLLIPRSREKTLLHPIDAFEDAAFLSAVKEHCVELRRLVASELRQKFGKFSVLDQKRRNAMDAMDSALLGSSVDVPELPQGRDWEKEVLVGVHAGPSMNHLHVHVLSTDHFSESVKHRKHYNSFATPFLVRLEEFPLAPDDQRRRPDHGGWLRRDMLCWRCGRNFGNRFVELKGHLAEEFEEWKRI